MRILGCTYALLALLACQASANQPAPAPAPAPGAPQPIVVRDASGRTLATVASAQPCRVDIDGLQISAPALPLLVDVAGARWSGETTTSGVLLRKDAALVARILDANGGLAVFDPAGAASIRVDTRGDVHGAGGQLLRSVRADAAAATTGDPVLHVDDTTVTGTRDPLIAAVLTAPELSAEVRALVACNRLLSNEATP